MLVGSKLEETFKQADLDTSLMPLPPIVEVLMWFRPSDPISAVETLRVLGV